MAIQWFHLNSYILDPCNESPCREDNKRCIPVNAIDYTCVCISDYEDKTGVQDRNCCVGKCIKYP